MRIAVIFGLMVLVGLVVAAVVVAGKLWGTPFTTETIDHSPPVVIVDLRSLSEYHAAQGQFEVTIDQEQDVQWLPSAIAGERVQSVIVTLPRPVLQAPVLDHDLSHVMNRDRGLLNRIGGVFSDNPTSEAPLYDAASAKMAAAAIETDLMQRAENNTKSMLYALLRGLGFQRVDIRFEDAAPTS